MGIAMGSIALTEYIGVQVGTAQYRINDVAVGRSCERERVNCTVLRGCCCWFRKACPSRWRLTDQDWVILAGGMLGSAQFSQTRLRLFQEGLILVETTRRRNEFDRLPRQLVRWLCVAWSSPLMGYIIIVVVVAKSCLPGLFHKSVLSRRIGEAI